MSTIIFNAFLLSVIIVFIVDVSGVIDEMETALAKWLKVKSVHIPKPWSCSLCLSFWGGLITLFVMGGFNLLNFSIVCMISMLTPVTYNILILLRESLLRIVGWLCDVAKIR